MIEIIGAALALGSIAPVVARRGGTCVTAAAGLFALCLAGIALATSGSAPWWLVAGGIVVAGVGLVLERRKGRSSC